jgi:hypothetical protein
VTDEIQTRTPAWPWCNIMIGQKHYPALILRWEKHMTRFGAQWSARVTYLDDNQHKVNLIPAARVSRVA